MAFDEQKLIAQRNELLALENPTSQDATKLTKIQQRLRANFRYSYSEQPNFELVKGRLVPKGSSFYKFDKSWQSTLSRKVVGAEKEKVLAESATANATGNVTYNPNTGAYLQETPDGSFTTVGYNQEAAQDRARQVDISNRLNRGEVLQPRDLLRREGTNIAAGSAAASNAQVSVRNQQLQRIREEDEAQRKQFTSALFSQKKDTKPILTYAPAQKTNFLDQKIEELRTAKARGQTSVVREAKLFAYGFAAKIPQTYTFSKNLVFNFPSTAKELGTGAITIVKNPRLIGDAVRQTDSATLGGVAFDFLLPEATAKSVTTLKNIGIKTFKPFVPVENVVDAAVLKGQQFPKGGSFNPNAAGEFEIVSAGPSKYPGLVAKSGQNAAKGLEDAGIYAAPKGRASAHFLEIGREPAEFSISLNPFDPVAKGLATPSVTEFTVRNVRTYPKSVLRTQGFEEANMFAQLPENRGDAFITKRSTTGITGRKANTAELEAIIPTGSKFKYDDSFYGYTKYKGEVVALRRARVLAEGEKVPTISRIKGKVANYVNDSYYSGRGKKTLNVSPSYSSRPRIKMSSYGISRNSGSSSVIPSLTIPTSYSMTGRSRAKTSASVSRSSSSTSRLRFSLSRGNSYSSAGTSKSYSPSKQSLTNSLSTSKTRGKKSEKKSFTTSIKLPKSNPKFKYTPSAYAAGLGIRGKKSKTLNISGLGVRPI